MRKTFYIIQREYLTRVRKKSFVILTILAPLFFVFISVGLPLLLLKANTSTQKILVKDESGLINALPDSSGIYFSFSNQNLSEEELKTAFVNLDDGYDAFVFIPEISPENPNGIRLYSKEQISITTRNYIESAIADKLEEINIEALQVDKEKLKRVRPQISIDDEILAEGESVKGDAAVASAIGYASGFLSYIILLIYGSIVMRGVMEEKQNRIVEVMMSSVKPFQLMMGKIIGIGLVGLTQFLLWIITAGVLQFILSGIFASQLSEMQTLSQQSSGADAMKIQQAIESLQAQPIGFFITLFLFYFLGGYFLYSALFAGIGSLATDNDADIQLYAFPVTLLILVSIFIMLAVIQQPHTQLAFWASIIPFSSPIVMPAILPFQPPAWQIALSMFNLILGFVFTTWLAAKIYRTGILMYGKKVKFKELLRWLFYRG